MKEIERKFLLTKMPEIVDEFSGALAGLFLCEVEFSDEAQAGAFVPPQWFGADVTEDGRYKNKSLAENGIP